MDVITTTNTAGHSLIGSNMGSSIGGVSSLGQSTVRHIDIGRARITGDIGILSTAYLDPHPALADDCIEHLLKMSNSDEWHERMCAVAHRLMPTARLVMMQNDPDPTVRTMVEKILKYKE